MKGISPMIATVLLIAFTVAVGGIVSLFLTGMTTTQTGLTEVTATNKTKCSKVLSIYYVKASLDKIGVVNLGTEQVNLTYIIFGDGNIATINASAANRILGGGSSAVITSSGTSWVTLSSPIGTNTSVRVQGRCMDLILLEGICRSGEACWSG